MALRTSPLSLVSPLTNSLSYLLTFCVSTFWFQEVSRLNLCSTSLGIGCVLFGILLCFMDAG
ncbi:hypothetical protein HMI54_011479 [Coelomomyces lativittatus]|nr:hypothetical protein HMI56_002478 [Coelomomyces lativittatus]KAJ1515865.1 hypothetical protein HMI54_011479 [Coelomomyces lativittatus]KAJ1517944.1 hypothetical protein HMI55_004600 [Coelomomyces lativittatus]